MNFDTISFEAADCPRATGNDETVIGHWENKKCLVVSFLDESEHAVKLIAFVEKYDGWFSMYAIDFSLTNSGMKIYTQFFNFVLTIIVFQSM